MTDTPEEPATTEPTRVSDPGYDPGPPLPSHERRYRRRRVADRPEEPATTEPTRVSDPGYDPGPPQVPLPPHASLPPEDLIGQAVERAAEKVAAVTVRGGVRVMNRMEAITAVIVLIILNVAALWVGLQNNNQTRGHRTDFKAVCQLLVDRALEEEESASRLANALAECLK